MRLTRQSGWSESVSIQEWALLTVLLGLAAVAWVITTYESGRGSMEMSPTMGVTWPVFLAIWVAMMIAMMFPSAAPMIMVFSRVARGKREQGQAFVPTSVFVVAYLAVWTASGAIAYVVASQIQDAAMGNMWLQDNGSRLAGAVFVAAGLYQLTPLKSICLSKCQSPFSFILTSWRDGYRGAIEMGARHGLFCLGCCWLLFAILFALGIMNIAAMAVLSGLILAEKVLPWGMLVARALGVALVLYGLLVAVSPALLP